MDPIAFTISGFEIRWYGILIATGMLMGVLLASYSSRLRKVSYDELLNIFLVSFPAAIIGARLYYVIFEFSFYKDNLIDIFNIRQGGLAIHGGLMGGIGAALIYTRIKKLNFLLFADAVAPSIIIGQAMGRWGNFFNSEAHGEQVTYEFISKFPQFIQKGMFIDGVYYHPTFLYESIWNLSVCIILLILLKKSYEKGMVFFAYIGFYSLGRFFIEGLRTDSLLIGSVRTAQIVSIIGMIMSLVFILTNILKRKKGTFD